MKFQYHANGWAQITFKVHPIAKAVFGCVNIVYEVSRPNTGRSLMRLTLFLHFLSL
jgi:hypothetical protein